MVRQAVCWAMLFNIAFSPILSALFHRDKKIMNKISKLVGNRMATVVYIILADFIVLWEEIINSLDLFRARETLIEKADLSQSLK